MINCFEEIRNRLDMRTVVEYYGIEVKRNNTCLCPFHDDHHPSAHIYPNAFHCFTCNLHYDVLGFVMALFNLSPIGTAKKLNFDFNLSITFSNENDYKRSKYSEEAQIRDIQRKKRERFEKWEEKSWQTINEYLCLVCDWYERYKPPTMDCSPENYKLDKKFAYALTHYPNAEEFFIDWVQQFSNRDKFEYKWVIDKMSKFLDEHKKFEENPQKPESPETFIKISEAD